MTELSIEIKFIGVHTMANGPSIRIVSKIILSSAAPLGNFATDSANAETCSVRINFSPVLFVAIVCKIALSEKQFFQGICITSFHGSNNNLLQLLLNLLQFVPVMNKNLQSCKNKNIPDFFHIVIIFLSVKNGLKYIPVSSACFVLFVLWHIPSQPVYHFYPVLQSHVWVMGSCNV